MIPGAIFDERERLPPDSANGFHWLIRSLEVCHKHSFRLKQCTMAWARGLLTSTVKGVIYVY